MKDEPFRKVITSLYILRDGRPPQLLQWQWKTRATHRE